MAKPEEILQTYDMYNAMVAFQPASLEVWYHQNAVECFRRQKIEIADQQLLVKLRGNDEEMVLQILRFAKYAARWSSEAGPRLFMALLQEYYKNPYLCYTQKTAETQKESSETESAMPIEVRENVWEFIAPLLTTSKWWANHLDPIGIIRKQKSLLLPQANVVLGWNEPGTFASRHL